MLLHSVSRGNSSLFCVLELTVGSVRSVRFFESGGQCG